MSQSEAVNEIERQRTLTFRDLDGEAFLTQRLGQQRYCITRGATTFEERRERLRVAILETGMDQTVIGRAPTGKPETYAQSFERFYGEPLIPKPTRTTRKEGK